MNADRPETHPASVNSAAHVVVEQIDAERIVLESDVHHHLARVLRVRVGENVTVTDGCGRWINTIVGTSFADTGTLQVVSGVLACERPSPRLCVAMALPKGDKPELAVQKLTELGIDHIAMFHGEHSVARWDDSKIAKNMARLAIVAREAVQQSRSVFLPAVSWANSLNALESVHSAQSIGGCLWRADLGGSAPALPSDRANEAEVVVAIGPEGGWSERERSIGTPVSLGQNVLRAETAAIAAGTLFTALRSTLVRSISQS